MKKIILTLLILATLVAACGAAASPQVYSYGDSGVSQNYGGAPAGADYRAFAPEEVAYDTGKVYDTVATSGESDGSNAGVDRIIIKNGSLSIAVQDPVANMATVLKLAEDMGGFVVSSNLYYYTLESGVEVPQANVTIRVPAERFEEAVATIKSGAGEVLSENITGQDVTQQYTDLQSRLRNLEAAEVQLQSIMDEATKTEDVLTVYNQLVYTREQIEVIKGQIKYFEESADFSAITVDIIAEAATQSLTIGGWKPVGVAKEAIQALINALKGIADAVIWLALFVLPVLIVLYLPFRLIMGGIKKMRSRKQKDTAPSTGP